MPTKTKPDKFKIFLRILYAVSLTIYIYFLVQGIDYYQTAHMDRPHHQDYRNLRSAGLQGQGFGILGSSMMLLMLLYSVRKRTRFFGNWGQLSRWLDIHIYFGVMGPLFIILHSSFRLNGLIAVSFWSMIAVASSGVLGRYLYLQIPRQRSGEELDQQEIANQARELTEDLKNTLDFDNEQVELFEQICQPQLNHRRGAFRQLLGMFYRDITRPLRRRKIRKQLKLEFSLEGRQLHDAVDLALRRERLTRRTLLLNKVQQLFHYWHVFHKPFAILMYIIMFIHVGVAIWLGYTWIF